MWRSRFKGAYRGYQKLFRHEPGYRRLESSSSGTISVTKPTLSSFALLSYLWYTLFAMRNRLLFRLGLLCSREGQMSSRNDRRAPGTAHRRLGKRGRDELPKVSQDTVQLYPYRPDPGRLWSGPASTHGHIDARARHPQPQPASCPAHVDTGGTNADTPTL